MCVCVGGGGGGGGGEYVVFSRCPSICYTLVSEQRESNKYC